MRIRSLLLALPLLAPATLAQASLEGRWLADVVVPGRVELDAQWLEFSGTADALEVVVTTAQDAYPLNGRFDAATNTLRLAGAGDLADVTIELALSGERLIGTAQVFGRRMRLDAGRAAPTAELERPAPAVVDFTRERPETITREGLPLELALDVSLAILEEMDALRIVGLSAAFVLDGELVDVRSFGWQDHHEDVPASERTMYRWASIGKPLTAVAALQLAEEGRLDLDRDVREYVPEWPDKGHPISARQLLGHLGGVTHYRDMQPRTLREYDLAHPWADAIVALDMFRETDLLSEPGTEYTYSTPGFVLLGAVIERAAGRPFPAQVTARVCRPLGMTTMQPDYQWVEIPDRATGYEQAGEHTVRSGDDNIAWKLAAGGWISTVEDLARFGIGLMGGELLTPAARRAMWEEQTLPDGSTTGYGLGIGVGSAGDLLTVSHSGGQNKTATYLLCVPERGTAVALMCNTSGNGLGDLARRLLSMLLAEEG